MSDRTSAPEEAATGTTILFVSRLIIGLVQGLSLYLLYSAYDAQSWPATDGLIFAPLLLASLFAPLLLSFALGEMRVATAIIWTLIAAAVLAGLAWYDIWSDWPQDWTFRNGTAGWQPHVIPSAGLFFFGAAWLFIAHALIAGGDIDRRFMARYTTHFDVAWKLAVQLALSAAFVGAFWLLLWLGASLFNLIKLDFFQKLIEHRWFSIPATALATAAAVHLTDARAGLVRGTRTLILVLLSWLLPLITLIAAGFLVGLIFTGLTPLWHIGHASALLLTAAATLIILINATHQDGEPNHAPPGVLKVSGSIAALALVPLVALAGYALWLRVGQYGWTVPRIATAACVLVAAAYTLGYVIAVAPSESWMKGIETWNFYVALLVLVVLGALFTPLASPARISVESQMARLQSGKIKPASFDYHYLRWSGGRYGRAALETLKASKDQDVSSAANDALNSRYSYEARPIAPVSVMGNITVYPAGRSLPASFFKQNWHLANIPDYLIPFCLEMADKHCDARFLDFDGDGREEILLIRDDGIVEDPIVLREDGHGNWSMMGQIEVPLGCDSDGNGFDEGVRAGNFKLAAPVVATKDIEINGKRFRFHPLDEGGGCKKK